MTMEETTFILFNALNADLQPLPRECLSGGREMSAMNCISDERPVHHLITVKQMSLQYKLQRSILIASIIQYQCRRQRVQPSRSLVFKIHNRFVDILGRSSGRVVAVDVIQDSVSQAAQSDLRKVEEPYCLALRFQAFGWRREECGVREVPDTFVRDVELETKFPSISQLAACYRFVGRRTTRI